MRFFALDTFASHFAFRAARAAVAVGLITDRLTAHEEDE
jgi:uncharacterized PurR-regulated membrane protein YhhQ (DUF165 family)